jgi:hypothetical protein
VVWDENDNPHNMLNKQKNNTLILHASNESRQAEIYTAETLIPKHYTSMFQKNKSGIINEELKIKTCE